MADAIVCASGIYEIRNKSNGKVYIGSSIKIEQRWGEHRRSLTAGTHGNGHLKSAWLKYGADSFSFSVIEYVPDILMLIVREQYWIDARDASGNNGYNINPTAASQLGKKHSEQGRRNMALAQTGRKHSNETRALMSIAQKSLNKTLSEEQRSVISHAQTGRSHSQETRKKMSASRMGLRPSEETRKKLTEAQTGNKKALGHKHTEESKQKMRDACRKRRALAQAITSA